MEEPVAVAAVVACKTAPARVVAAVEPQSLKVHSTAPVVARLDQIRPGRVVELVVMACQVTTPAVVAAVAVEFRVVPVELVALQTTGAPEGLVAEDLLSRDR